jgi:integrase
MAQRKAVTNMSAYKDKKTGTWYAFFYYRNWQGENKGKTKRGFATKREALEWQHDFLEKHSGNLDMNFSSFVEVYTNDMKERLKLNTWMTKQTIIDKKILPYFADKKINEIKPAHIIAWQNEIMSLRDKKGNKYAPTYLKTIHNQISAIFNHAVRFYELSSNPAAKVGNMGKEKTKEMLFWTKEEYLKFSDSMMDKPMSFYAFEVLYWCGIRSGELLALTAEDFDFEKLTVRINKSYQRINRKDVVTDPKTTKSVRIIKMPDFLADELQEYIKSIYGIKAKDRLFPITKSYLHNEMKRGSKEQGIKRIRVHDLRHSHVSLLIEMGFSAVAVADRVGHESIDITYRYAHMFPSKQTEIADKLNIERGRG